MFYLETCAHLNQTMYSYLNTARDFTFPCICSGYSIYLECYLSLSLVRRWTLSRLGKCQPLYISLSCLDLYVAGSLSTLPQTELPIPFLVLPLLPDPNSLPETLTLIVYPLLLTFSIVRNMLRPSLHLLCLTQVPNT